MMIMTNEVTFWVTCCNENRKNRKKKLVVTTTMMINIKTMIGHAACDDACMVL